MAISALENKVSRLEVSIDDLEKYLWIASVAVAVGVTLEVYFLIHAYLSARKEWLKGVISSPPKPSFKFALFEIASVLLVVAGIVGELWVGVISASRNSELRSVNNRLVGLIREKAGLADKDAGDAKERAGKLEKEAARLNKLAQDEALARANIEAQLQWRTISDDQERKILAAIPASLAGLKPLVMNVAGDAEGAQYATYIVSVLHKAGMTIDGTSAGMFVGVLPEGVLIRVREQTNTQAAGTLQRAFSGAGIEMVGALNPGLEAGAIEILVGVKPHPRTKSPK